MNQNASEDSNNNAIPITTGNNVLGGMRSKMIVLVNRYARQGNERYTENQRNDPIWLLHQSFEQVHHRSSLDF